MRWWIVLSFNQTDFSQKIQKNKRASAKCVFIEIVFINIFFRIVRLAVVRLKYSFVCAVSVVNNNLDIDEWNI
jgi:hypothetical protein